MKKVFFILLLCACLISVLVVSSGAVEWFGNGSANYTVTTSYNNFVSFLTLNGFVDSSHTFSARMVTSAYSQDGDWYYSSGKLWYGNTSNDYLSSSYISICQFIFTTNYELDNSILDLDITSPGFVSDGFSSAIGFAGTIAGELLDNSTIIIAISLAVGVTLVGWGIGKVKSLIMGF